MNEDPTAAMRRALTVYENTTTFFDQRGIPSTVRTDSMPQSVVRTAKLFGPMFLTWVVETTRVDDFEFTLCVGESSASPVGTMHYSSAMDRWEILVRERETGPRLGFERCVDISLNGEQLRRHLERVCDFLRSSAPPYDP